MRSESNVSLFLPVVLVLCLFLRSSDSFTTRPLSIGSQHSAPTQACWAHHSKNNHNNHRKEDDDEELRYQEWQQKQADIERKVRLQIQVDDEQEKIKMDKTFDLAAEMMKVESISQGLPLDSPELKVDEQISKLEGSSTLPLINSILSRLRK
ncbi:hypothetical protein MHU86_3991 [Fragilaria crotonensis]|nr:hypothetical protein MHU86_3991 [Fragilaria crotonensis]